jgi:hypothetical protein
VVVLSAEIWSTLLTGESLVAVDEGLANRVRQVLAATEGVLEKRMFGGLAFLVQGNMCVGVELRNVRQNGD